MATSGPFTFSHYNPAEGGWMWRDASGQIVSSQDIASVGQVAPNPPGAHTFPGGVLPTSASGAAPSSGAPAASGAMDPASLAALFRQPDVTLPGATEAKGALRGLQLSGVRGLETLLAADPNARRASLEAAFYDPAAADINTQADRAIRDANEIYGARGVLTSTIPVDYTVAPLERERMNALARARSNAVTSAGSELRADTTNQAQLLGQAFNQGAAGLQGEASVEMANRNANQSATQSGYTTGLQLGENAANRAQQENQFGRSLAQQKELQTAGFANAERIADKAATAGAIGGSIGGLAQLFGPAANTLLANRFPSLFGA